MDRVSVATTGEGETILLCWFLNSAFTFFFSFGFLVGCTVAFMATILRCGLLGYESLTTMITEFRKFNCTTHLLLLVAVCCCVVLLGALFRLTSIKLICGQQNSQLGNNWATNISKKVELGNKKEKEKCTETQQKQALNKQKKVNYFPIQNLLNI
ncbi:MAG: hypothetical protein IPN39_17095 [Chitinophagaceae bacterium]|nr:hypothetical protein [Chitinophagaceae bacterium]